MNRQLRRRRRGRSRCLQLCSSQVSDDFQQLCSTMGCVVGIILVLLWLHTRLCLDISSEEKVFNLVCKARTPGFIHDTRFLAFWRRSCSFNRTLGETQDVHASTRSDNAPRNQKTVSSISYFGGLLLLRSHNARRSNRQYPPKSPSSPQSFHSSTFSPPMTPSAIHTIQSTTFPKLSQHQPSPIHNLLRHQSSPKSITTSKSITS